MGLSTSKPVPIEFTIRQVAPRFLQSTFFFRSAKGNPVAGSVIRLSLPHEIFSGRSKIDDVAHPGPGGSRIFANPSGSLQ